MEIRQSARRHGIADTDVLHAVGRPVVVVDHAESLLEVIVLELADDRFLAIHAMPLCRSLSDADIEELADEAERGHDVEDLKRRRPGRPLLGSAPAEVVPVRLDPELKQAVEDQGP